MRILLKKWIKCGLLIRLSVYVLPTVGRPSEQFADVQRLNRATPEQRSNYKVTPYGIYWPELDENLSFEVFFSEKQNNVLYDLFIAHPELNASAIARRLGMSQSLFAQYISGTKKPSQERVNLILETIKNIGRELVSAQF